MKQALITDNVTQSTSFYRAIMALILPKSVRNLGMLSISNLFWEPPLSKEESFNNCYTYRQGNPENI